MALAVAEHRAIITHNAKHFAPMAVLPSRLFEQSKAGLFEGATVTQRHQLSQPVSS